MAAVTICSDFGFVFLVEHKTIVGLTTYDTWTSLKHNSLLNNLELHISVLKKVLREMKADPSSWPQDEFTEVYVIHDLCPVDGDITL